MTIDQFVQAPIFTVIILAFFALVEGKGLEFLKAQIQNDLRGILIKNWSVLYAVTHALRAAAPLALRRRWHLPSRSPSCRHPSHHAEQPPASLLE